MKKRFLSALFASLALACLLALAACGDKTTGGTLALDEDCTIVVSDSTLTAKMTVGSDGDRSYTAQVDGDGLALVDSDADSSDDDCVSLSFVGSAAGEQTVTIANGDSSKEVTLKVTTDDSGRIKSIEASDNEGCTGSYTVE